LVSPAAAQVRFRIDIGVPLACDNMQHYMKLANDVKS
jgi:hypothetical protein